MRYSGAIRVAPTSIDFSARPGGVTRAAPAGLLLGFSLSSRYNAALAGVAPILQGSGQLGLQGPLSHRPSELFGPRL